ncbi:MAG: O-antigen ligase family protein [Candidatus Omnitrophica bacterium]|nr:O-antigen ligase family protein [Candidatus Omnitrophota bacterium]
MIKKVIPDWLFEAILVFLIVFVPLGYGSVKGTFLFVVQITILVILALYLARSFPGQLQIVYPRQTYLLVVFIAIVIFQILPLPQAAIKFISSKTYFFKHNYMPLDSQSGFLSLSFYRAATKAESINLLSFLILFLVTLNTIKKRSQFERLFLTIIIWGAILSFYGVIKKYFIINAEITGAFSTFGNRNHFAGYMVMVAPLAVGHALYYRDKAKKIIFGFLAVLISASVFISLSRAGSLSLIFSLLLMGIFSKRKFLIKSSGWIIPLVLIFGLGLVLIPGLAPIKARFIMIEEGFLGRLKIAANSLAIIKDFPLFGIGLGNFSYIFPYYQEFAWSKFFYHLHNDHLQMVVETGLIGAFFYLGFIVTIFKSILKKISQRQDSFVKIITLSGACGLIGVLLHSFFEFNFHIPATTFLFWLILALIYKCVNTQFNHHVTNKNRT